jgi:N-acetylglucosamine kinase-like BadF-type ATPase
MEPAMQATRTAVMAAWEAASLPPKKAHGFVGGYTGADWPDEYDLLREAVEGMQLADAVTIVNDSIAALRGGTHQPYGAILVAGTGANCAVRAPDGHEFIYHYYHDDDLQGGSALGRAALKAIFRAETGRPPQTSLKAPVLALFEITNVDALMRGLVEGHLSENRIPEIAPLVFAEASKGDPAANAIVTHFATGCAELLVNALQQLNMADLAVEIVISGGVFKSDSRLLRDTLFQQVHKVVPGAVYVDARYEPVVGATILALERYGGGLDEKTQSNLERTAQEWRLIRV